MSYRLTCKLLAPLTLNETFRAFEDPRNLARITPPWLSFVVTTPGEIDMRPGAEIDYIIRWLGLPMKWRTLITEYERPRYFVDEQLRGPYSLWHHRHTFEETPDGTVVADAVDYRLPMGPLGAIAHAAMVRHQLLGIFNYRQRAMDSLLGARCTTIEPPRIVKL